MKINKEIPTALDEQIIWVPKQKQPEMILNVNSLTSCSFTIDMVLEKIETQIVSTLDSLRESQSFNDDKI